MEVAALGRPFGLGMLYDCRQDSLVPGFTLWDHDDLKNNIRDIPKPNSNFEIVASESIEGKSSVLDVKASLRASFLCGLVEVEGSAKYLNEQRTSKNQARVTLMYKVTTKFQELSMNQLGRENIKHGYVFEEKTATHVVTGILYGAQAFFIFDREMSEKEDHRDIQGNMKVMINSIPCLSIEGEGSLKMENKDKANVEKFSCKFQGDFSLQKNPVSFRDAVEVYQSLPKLLGEHGENAVPMKVWLLPLERLNGSAAKLVRQISIGLIQKAQHFLEDFSELEMRCNDAMSTITAQQFPQINKKVKSFKQMCSEFKLNFQKTLAKKLPSIRGGGEEETELAEILKKIHSTPFNFKDLNEWMDCKDREIFIIKSITKSMKNTKIIPNLNHLFKESCNTEFTLCFVFTSLGSTEPYLSVLSMNLGETTKPDDFQDPHNRDVEKEQWYASKEATDEMRKKAKLFSDFAEANKENENIKFFVVACTNETQKGSVMYLYQDGFSVSENFEPPSKPETVTAGDITYNSVTLKISPPRFGAESVTSYSVEYCVCGEDEWQKQIVPKAEEVTVSDLRPNTEYLFRCRAVTSAGFGPAIDVSTSMKTSSSNSLREDLKDISWTTNSDIPVVYELPMEKENIGIQGCQKFTFGKVSMKQNRTIILLGPAGSQKSTLIDAMINYIVGIEWKDGFRFRLIDEDNQATSQVTLYKVNHQVGFKIPFSLTIVDTPDFDGFVFEQRQGDRKIMEQLGNLFSAELGVSEIDAVCLVAQADLPQLTVTYVFDSVLSIFGKDLQENIRFLVTSADTQLPPVLEAIIDSRIPCPRTDFGLPVHFKFNTSALFANNTGGDGDWAIELWNMGTKGMDRFFQDLNVMNTKSLTMTQEVLRDRWQIENSVNDLFNGYYGIKSSFDCPLYVMGAYLWEETKPTFEKLYNEEVKLRPNVKRFMEIQLKPSLRFTPEHIEMLIEKEKSECRPESKARFDYQYLKLMEYRADCMTKMERGESSSMATYMINVIEGKREDNSELFEFLNASLKIKK